MRIFFFNYEYPPLGGGAGNAAFYLLREYSKISNLTADFITSSIDCEYHLEKIRDNVFVHRLPIGKNKSNLHFQSQKDILVYLWKAYFFSRKLVKKDKYDLSHSFFTIPCGFISLLLERKYKTPYIISLRGSDVPGYSERFSFLYLFIKPLIRKIWKNSFSVISNSQGLKELALKTNPNQEIGVIPNGIDIEQFQCSSYEVGLHKNFIILCVTRITPRKGVKYLIKAFRKLSEKHQNIFLQIIGDGDEREKLESLVKKLNIQNKVEFTGLISHDKLPSYFQNADIFVLPSLNEGMSNAMLEALASGLPIIATDTGGVRELVNDGENGFIIKMRDSNDIADKIENLINDKNLRERMGQTSRKIAESMSWGKVAKEYVEVYKKTK